MKKGIEKLRVPIIGGHLHPDTPYSALDVAILGKAKKNAVILSSTAQPGEVVIAAYDTDGKPHPQFQLSFDSTSFKESSVLAQQLGATVFTYRGDDIVKTIEALRSNGVEFLAVPDTYYDMLRRRKDLDIKEGIADLQRLGILCDIEGDGYLLQLFTKPICDRPTFFFEFIQRQGNSQGFGKGNFQALFESIELDQKLRVAAIGIRARGGDGAPGIDHATY